MNKDTKFNPYDGPKPIFSIFQGSYGGYHGPCLVIYENGLVVKAVYVNPEDFFFEPKIMSTVISTEELNFLKNEISIQIDEKVANKMTEYKESYLIWRSDTPTINIMCNISTIKYIRIEDSYIKNDKINYFLHGEENEFETINDREIQEYLKLNKPDEIPSTLKDCLKLLCEYKFIDLKDYVPYYFEFNLETTKSEGETVDWSEDLPDLESFIVEEHSSSFLFFIDGKYYKKVLEFYLNNQHKNIRFRNADREMYYYPQLIFPHEDLFNYND